MQLKVLACAALMALVLIACGDDEPAPSGGGTTPAPATGGDDTTPRQPSKSNPMNIFAHYMPWFETPESNDDAWGWHWTMNTRNPAVVDAEGRRQIASHYYPLTGPYASSDDAVLDYQCLLMKYSGIDGVMVDWYGTATIYDYPLIKRNTERLAAAIERNGLKMAIVYEDATLLNAATSADERTAQAKRDMQYLQSNFFTRDSYVKIAARPLLMVFGPQALTSPAQWEEALSALSTKPCLVCLNGHSSRAGSLSAGEFVWINPAPDYSVASRFATYIGGAMPGFRDYYVEGGDRATGYTTYDRENGALFSRQLAAARSAGLGYLQVTTWNDYGEGTVIEPTREYGYQYLTALQQFAGVDYRQSHLELISRWYAARVAHPRDTRAEKARLYLAALMPESALPIIQELEAE